MTARWMMPLLVVVAAGGIGFGVSRYVACRTTAPSLDRLRDVSFLQRELNLTDMQRSQVEGLHETLATRLDACSERHCGARMRLGQSLADETNGNARADAVLAEMCRAYEESERAALDHIRQVRALLDTRQRQRFDKMLKECLCRSCPTCRAPRDDAKPDGQEKNDEGRQRTTERNP